jgi:hypothetical protein
MMPVSKVFKICVAYESGYGHGYDHDDLPNPYKTGTNEHEAYNIGYENGLANCKASAEDDLIAIAAADKIMNLRPETIIEPDPEMEKEISDLVDGVDIREDCVCCETASRNCPLHGKD